MSGLRPKLRLHVDELEPIQARPGWAKTESRVRAKLAKLKRIDVRVSDRASSTRSEPLSIDASRLVRFCVDLELDLADQDGTKTDYKKRFAIEVVAETLDGEIPDFSGFARTSHFGEIGRLLQELHSRVQRILPSDRTKSTMKTLRDAYTALVAVYAPEPVDPAHELTGFFVRAVKGITETEATLAADEVARVLWPQYVKKNLERSYDAVGARKRKRELRATRSLTGTPRDLIIVGRGTEPKT